MARVALLWIIALALLLTGQQARAEEFKKYSYDGVNPEGYEYPNVTWNIVRGSATPGTYYVTTTDPGHSTSHVGRAQVDVHANGSMTVRDLSYNVISASIGPIGYGNRPGGYPSVGYTVRTASFSGTIVTSATVSVFTWAASYTVVPYTGQAPYFPKARSFTIQLVPTPPLTFYIGVKNACGESRPLYLQTGSTVIATGDVTTAGPPGVEPSLFTYQEEREASAGETWAWFIGTQAVASGTITAAQVSAGVVEAGPILFDCPDELPVDSDGDLIPDDQDPDRDGDGIPNERDISPDGPDLDKDGVPDARDEDDDGDGAPDLIDPTPRGGPDSQPNDGTKTPPPPSSGGTVTPPNPKPPLTGNPSTGLDVYDDVKAALEDVSAQTTVPPVDGTVDLGAQPEGVGEKAVMSRIDSNIATAEKEVGNVILRMIEFGADNTGIDLPTGLGKKSWWDITFDWVDGSTKTVRVDLAPYDGTVTALRNLCLFVAYIGAWWFSVKTIRGGIA